MPSPPPLGSCASFTGNDVSFTIVKTETLQYAEISGSYQGGPWLYEKYEIANTTPAIQLKFNMEFSCNVRFMILWSGIQNPRLCDCPSASIFGRRYPDYPATTPSYVINYGNNFIIGSACIPEGATPPFYYKPKFYWLNAPASRGGIAGDSVVIELKTGRCTNYDIGKLKASVLMWSYQGVPFPTLTPQPSIGPTMTPFPTFGPSPTPVPNTPMPTPEENGKGLWVWGQNAYGQLGNSDNVSTSSIVQNAIPGKVWKSISIGPDFMGGILTNNSLWTWGLNSYFNLGYYTKDFEFGVQQVDYNEWYSFSCGFNNAAGIRLDGTLWVWGSNAYGQLGNNSDELVIGPVQTVAGGNKWNAVSLGMGHVAAIKSDGSLWLWGSNSTGQLGNPNFESVSSPVQTIYATKDWLTVKCGYNFTLATKRDGSLWVWGGNYGGNLGLGNNNLIISTPTQVASVNGIWYGVAPGFNFAGGTSNSFYVATPIPTSTPTPTPTPT